MRVATHKKTEKPAEEKPAEEDAESYEVYVLKFVFTSCSQLCRNNLRYALNLTAFHFVTCLCCLSPDLHATS